MASIYLRGKVYWILFYDNRRKIQYSLKTKDKKVAQFKKNEIENKIAVGDSPLLSKDILVASCLNEFKKYREGRISTKTKSTDHYRIERFLRDSNIIFVKTITEATVKSHLDDRIKAGISNQTANHTIRILKTFMNFCEKERYILFNPIKKMPKYPIFEKEQRFLSHKEIKAVLHECKDMNIYPLIYTALYTGMRKGELINLTWEDVDLKNKIITVHKTKSKKFRKIPIHDNLLKVLEKNRGSGKCFNVPGFYWKLYYLRKKLARAGVPRFRFHDLRHTFASMMIKSGVDILTISKLLGHSSIVVTQIYSHLYQDHIKDAIQKLKI